MNAPVLSSPAPSSNSPSAAENPAVDRARTSPATRLLVLAVEGYQWLFSWRPSPCRFVPSCSNYALEALEVHGAARGSLLAIRRLGRCHPWGSHGPDPVPRKYT